MAGGLQIKREPEKLRVDWLAALAAALGLSIWGGFPQATVAVFGSTVMFAALLLGCGWRGPK